MGVRIAGWVYVVGWVYIAGCVDRLRSWSGFGRSSLTHLTPAYDIKNTQGGGGPFTVLPYESKGQVPLNLPIFAGHKGDVLVGV